VDALLARAMPLPAEGRRHAVLDIGCGKGEILIRALERTGGTGIGVDSNPTFISEARCRGRHRVAEADLRLYLSTYANAPVPRGMSDLVICTGATHALDPDLPDPEYLERLGARADEMRALDGTLAAAREAGWVVLAHLESTPQEWDEYEESYELGVRAWLMARPADPQADEFRARIDAWADGYARWGRDTMGFVTMALKR